MQNTFSGHVENANRADGRRLILLPPDSDCYGTSNQNRLPIIGVKFSNFGVKSTALTETLPPHSPP